MTTAISINLMARIRSSWASHVSFVGSVNENNGFGKCNPTLQKKEGEFESKHAAFFAAAQQQLEKRVGQEWVPENTQKQKLAKGKLFTDTVVHKSPTAADLSQKFYTKLQMILATDDLPGSSPRIRRCVPFPVIRPNGRPSRRSARATPRM